MTAVNFTSLEFLQQLVHQLLCCSDHTPTVFTHVSQNSITSSQKPNAFGFEDDDETTEQQVVCNNMCSCPQLKQTHLTMSVIRKLYDLEIKRIGSGKS